MIETINLFAQLWWDWMTTMSWQVGLLIIFIASLDRLIRRWAWPQLRYALWSLVLIKLLLPPTFASPGALAPRLKPWLNRAVVAVVEPRPQEGPSVLPVLESLAKVDTVAVIHPDPVVVVNPKAVPMGQETKIVVSEPGPVVSFLSALNWRVYVMAVWAAGVLTLGVFLAVRLYRLSKGSGSGSADGSLPESFYNRMQCCARRLELRRLPKVVVTRDLSCPAVFGAFRPVLLMPRDCLAKLSGKDVEHMLLHELAHIKRGDLIAHGLYMLLQVVYWYNPLLWLVRRQVHHLRELCCDATVARLLKHKISAYRQTLLETARRFLSTSVEPGLGLLGLFEDSNRLLVRLNWLEKPTWRYRKMKNTVVLAVIVTMLACVLPMARVQPTVAADEDQAKLKQAQAELLEQQKQLELQLKELELKRLKLKEDIEALNIARQAEQTNVQKVKVEEQKVKVEKVRVQAQQMQDWHKQIQAWETSDAMQQWRKDMEQWAQKQAQINLGQAEGPLPPAPPMPAMPPMPAEAIVPVQAMPGMPPMSAEAIAPAPALTPAKTTVSETIVLQSPPKVKHERVSVVVPRVDHEHIAIVAPQASASASADAVVVEDSTSKKQQTIVMSGPDSVRKVQSIMQGQKEGRHTIERVEMQTLPLSAGAIVNIANHDGGVNVRGTNGNTCQVQAIISIQGPDEEMVRMFSKQVSFNMNQTDKGINIAAVEPKKVPDGCTASVGLQILVPQQTHVNIVHQDGSVQVESFRGQVNVTLGDGSVLFKDVAGDMALTLEDARVCIERCDFSKGQIAMEDGDIECMSVGGTLDCKLRDGHVKVTYTHELPDACSINVLVEDGQIEFLAPAAMFGPDAPDQAKRVDDGAEWHSTAGNRTITLKTEDGSIKVEKQ